MEIGDRVWVDGEDDYGTIVEIPNTDDVYVKMDSDGVVVNAWVQMIVPV